VKFWIYFSMLLVVATSLAQSEKASSGGVNFPARDYVAQHRQEVLQELEHFLALPNIASDTANIQKNADALATMLGARGLKAQLLRVGNAPPAVYAALPADPRKRTVIFYAHYDGQPVQKAEWTQDPWAPVLKDSSGKQAGNVGDPQSRIYARSASDDKAAIVGLLTALDALRAARLPLSVNVKFLFEGEEEAGSPHLPEILTKYADDLQSDLWVICDGPSSQNGAPQLLFGSRGVTTVQITAFGPNRPLHSGHYGNWAPNPIVVLADLIAKLRTTDAEITVPHFYDPVRPLTSAEQTALRNLPELDRELKKEFALSRTEGKATLPEQILKPGLNVDRIEGGGTGPNAANAIPSSATAYIDFRLVPNQTPELVRSQLEAYLRAMGFHLVDRVPTSEERLQYPKLLQVVWGAGYPPQRTAIDSPVAQAFIRAIRTVAGDRLVLLPTIGGSTPSYLFEKQFEKPVIGLPIANYDNNQHAANENLRLQNLWEGIELYAGAMEKLGDYWK
jgi:acetylornithine deacetylase/succinyl-diaminopimelate desuccinylase-like protein